MEIAAPFFRLTIGALLAAGACVHAADGPLKLETRTIDSTTSDFKISARYPHSGVKAIDEPIVAWVNAEVADLKQQGPPNPEWASGAYTLDIDYEVARNDAKGLALRFNEMTYTGGAHPNHGVRTFNYRMPQAQSINLQQVIDGDRGLARVSELAIADLQRLTAPDMGADPDGIKQGAAPDWPNFENFLLLPEAIEFVFPPYQVAPYVFGTQESTIPLSRLRDVLRSDMDAPETSAPSAASTGAASGTPAPSFDCSKATTTTERVICSDATLAQLDKEAARNYVQRMAAAPGTERATVRADQRAWLKRRDQACKDQSGSAAVACLTGVYRTRQGEAATP